MKTKATQIDRVLEHLKAGNELSSMDAFRLFKCTRLSAIIFSLRYNRGIKVKSYSKTVKGATFAVYYIGRNKKA